MRGWKTMIASVAVLVVGGLATARAQSCSDADIAGVIDQAGARLRQISMDSQPKLRAKLKELAQKQGWGDSEMEERGRAFVVDDETRSLDQRAADLFIRLDRLGDAGQSTEPVCQRLDQARVVAAQLVEVTSAKAVHVSARIDSQLRPSAAASPAPSVVAIHPSAPQAKPEPKVARAASPPPVPPAAAKDAVVKDAAAKDAPARGPQSSQRTAWDAQTVRSAETPIAVPAPDVMAALPKPPDPGDLGYSPEEIAAAGNGFFGTISAGLASVIDQAFNQFGRPSGYILGNEGGGAFLAGLRYGDGMLVTKQQGERKVYWQGPSVGYDFGLTGSRVLFLVYSLDDPEDLFSRFAGVDGSAYLVGGVGMTILKKGKVILAPIRTGLGVRLGANVGYLKFTPTPSLNPF